MLGPFTWHLRTCAGALVAVVFLGGCSLTSGNRPFSREAREEPLAKDEATLLKEHILELEQRAAMAEVEIRRLRSRISELEGQSAKEVAVASPVASPVASDADLETSARVDSPDLSPSGGPVERSVERSGTEELEVADLPVSPVIPSAVERTPIPPSTTTASGALDATAQALYDRGYTLFHQGKYLDSETAFQQFLQNYSRTVLGDNAQFWIAEARYARGDVRGALAAFEETAERFPGGNKLPEAILKAGDCLRDLGDSEAARLNYQRVVRDFSDSAAASMAEERLGQIP